MNDQQLIAEIEAHRELMIAVATGGPRIIEVNPEYIERSQLIRTALEQRQLRDPNPYQDLWGWYGKWSSGDLPTYQSRRVYVAEIYAPLLSALVMPRVAGTAIRPIEPTGWERVDRGLDSIRERLASAKNEEDFQTVGLLCRETLISLAQAVYDPEQQPALDGIRPSQTDAGRMLEAYIAKEFAGSANEEARKHAKAALSLGVALQHRRTANARDAALCAEATTSVVNIIAIVDRGGIRVGVMPRHSVRKADQKLFEQLIQALPSKGSISFISGANMAGFSFSRSQLEQLQEFVYEWDDAEHQFLNEELESRRAKLHHLADEYLSFLSLNTWSTHGDFSSVPPEWEYEQPQRFRETVDTLHLLAGEIVKAHHDLFKTARHLLEE